MNSCTLCNPDNLKRRNEAYKLLAAGCSVAAVATKTDIPYSVLQRCWSEHDTDPVRSTERRIVKAKKRLARAEAHHKKLKAPEIQSRLEMDAALKSVMDLERHLDELKRPLAASNAGLLTVEYFDELIAKHERDKQSGEARIPIYGRRQ
jgi:hypothetical protein